MKKRFYIAVLIVTVMIGSLFADPSYFCVIENDTIRVTNENELEMRLDEFLINFGNAGFPHIEAVLDAYVKEGNNEYFRYRIDKGNHVMIDTVVFGDYSPVLRYSEVRVSSESSPWLHISLPWVGTDSPSAVWPM